MYYSARSEAVNFLWDLDGMQAGHKLGMKGGTECKRALEQGGLDYWPAKTVTARSVELPKHYVQLVDLTEA